MKKIRDFIYDYNDIFVALLIIAVAAVVIVWRVNSIMDYPNYVAEKGGNNPVQTADANLDNVDLTPTTVDENLNENPENTSPEDSEEPSGEGAETPAETPATTDAPKPSGKFEVPKGSSASKIGDLLVQAGYVTSKNDFMTAISGKETKIKAGTFTIPEGATAAEIADILTK